MLWSFVILIRWWAFTQMKQMNAKHSTHHEVAKALSEQVWHMMSVVATSALVFMA